MGLPQYVVVKSIKMVTITRFDKKIYYKIVTKVLIF